MAGFLAVARDGQAASGPVSPAVRGSRGSPREAARREFRRERGRVTRGGGRSCGQVRGALPDLGTDGNWNAL